MKKILFLLFAFTSLLGISAFGQSSSVALPVVKKKDPKQWTILKEKEYEISYPSEWTLDQSGQQGTKFVALAPTAGEGLQFRANINLLIQDLKGQPMSLKEFSAFSINQIQTMMPGSKMILSKKETEENQDYQRVVFTASRGELELKFEQYYYIIDSQAYILTFTSKEESFKSYLDLRQYMFGSFKPHS